jgi:hypothetical protein
MANLIVNGEFSLDLTSWVVSGVTCAWVRNDGHSTLGCCEMQPTGADPARVYQYKTMPGTVITAGTMVRLRFSLKATALVPVAFTATLQDVAGNIYWTATYSGAQFTGTWLDISERCAVPQATGLRLLFSVPVTASANRWRIDDVYLDVDAPSTGSCEELALELRKNRQDMLAQKHPEARYREIVNRAISDAPMPLWKVVYDETIVADVDVREYSLATLTTITDPHQVARLWVEDDDGWFHEMGEWEVLDNGAACLLVLYESPSADGLKFRIEYLKPWDALDCADVTETTDLDHEWIVSRGMVLLLAEANPQDEGERWLDLQRQVWEQRCKMREAKAGQRRRTSKAKRYNWTKRLG